MLENIAITATHFTVWDLGALVILLVSWAGMGFLIEREGTKKPSTHSLMRDYRMRWMEHISSDLAAPRVVWEAKILLIVLILAYGLLKFIWSIRLFGYCAVVMAATPNDPDDSSAYATARKAGKLNIYAARSFNRGLRAIYFALAALAWLLGPFVLFTATLSTVWMLYRREFNSLSRTAILESNTE